MPCLAWCSDNPNEHLAEVEIDNDKSVAALKKVIRDGHTPMLDKFAAHDLVLWKCSIPANDNLKKTLCTLNFGTSDTSLYHLPPASEISEHFETSLARKTIHILVEVPTIGE